MKLEQKHTNIQLHQILRQILTDFGEDVVTDNRLIALLSDLGGSEFNQYKFIVRCSIEKGIGNQILEMKNLDEADRMLKIGNLKQSLIDEYSLQEDKVNYIFNCFLYALGIINDIEQIDNSAVQNTERDTEGETTIPFKPDPFIFDELLTLFRKHSTIARGNGRVSKRKEISNLKVNILTFTQAVETKYNVQLNLPSLSSFLMVEDFLDYIINTYQLKSTEGIIADDISQKLDNSNDIYIKVENPSLVNTPAFSFILDIIRHMACSEINEYTKVNDRYIIWYSNDWYGDLPEKIQKEYGVRPELPKKERFETIGDLIKYLIQKYEITERIKTQIFRSQTNTQKVVSYADNLPIAASAFATLVFSFIYLYLISENAYSTGFWDGLNSGFNLILYFVGAPILTAAITWWAYDSFWPNRDLGFFGYLLRLYGYTILLSFIPQWWLVLLVGGIEYMYCNKNV